MKNLRKTLLLLLFSLCLFNAKAQLPELPVPGGWTIENVQKMVKDLLDELQNKGTVLEGGGSTVIASSISQISELLNQFNAVAKENITTPIISLSNNVQSLANQLFSISNRINSILGQQQVCLLLNAQTALAGLQTIVSEIKILGFKVNKNSTARLNYFQFDGHSAGIIPEAGGRVRILGFKLWSSNYPPDVKLLNGKVILETLQPERSEDDNSFNVNIDNSTIKKYAGSNLLISVMPFNSLLGKHPLGTYNIPFSIPSSYKSEIKIVAHLVCQSDVTNLDTLDYRTFKFENFDSGVTVLTNHTECWNVVSPDMAIGYVTKNLGVQGSHSVVINRVNNCISTSGSIAQATAGGGTVIKTTWFDDIAPTIIHHKNVTTLSDTTSKFTSLDNQTTNICLDIRKGSKDLNNNTFWFEIIRNDGSENKIFYQSRRISDTHFSDDFNGMLIDAVLNPMPIDGKAQLCIKLVQPQCGL